MKTLIQGGWVVGFDGNAHEVIKDGVVVYDGNRVEFVGKEYSQPVDQTDRSQGLSGFSRFHRHPFSLRVSMPATTFSTIPRRPISLPPIISPMAARRAKGAHPLILKDVDIGQRFSLIHVLKSGVTTTFDIGGAGRRAATLRRYGGSSRHPLRRRAELQERELSFTIAKADWNTTGMTSAEVKA